MDHKVPEGKARFWILGLELQDELTTGPPPSLSAVAQWHLAEMKFTLAPFLPKTLQGLGLTVCVCVCVCVCV